MANFWIGDDSTQDLRRLYGPGSLSEFLTLRVRHGGSFLSTPNRVYVGGLQHVVYYVPIATFDLQMMNDIVKTLGHRNGPFYFHSLRSGESMDYGLERLENNWDFGEFCLRLQNSVAPRIANIFVEHQVRTVNLFYPQSIAAASVDHLALRILGFIHNDPSLDVERLVEEMGDRYGTEFDPVRVQQAYNLAVSVMQNGI